MYKKKEKKKKKNFVKKFETFGENDPPTSLIKKKVINFASGNTSITAKKFPSTILERTISKTD